MRVIRKSSRLHATLGGLGVRLVEHAAEGISRMLPHVDISTWDEGPWQQAGCVWATGKREVRVTIAVGARGDVGSRSLTATVKRTNIPGASSVASEIIDIREHGLCDLIAKRISYLITEIPGLLLDQTAVEVVSKEFDEFIVAGYVKKHHGLELPVSAVIGALHTLAEQSYENKALTFGCILDTKHGSESGDSVFPESFLESKKYKALSDGFRTAYLVSTDGQVVDFVDLERYGRKALSEKNHFPDWAEAMARVSRAGKCGISLSRQGDILIFDEGTLRFTYRFGQWQYWNHAHLIKLLRDRAKAQGVPKRVLGNVVGAIYRAALDVSFRRSGGLFVLLHNRRSLHEIVRFGDALKDVGRRGVDAAFDAVVADKNIYSLPRSVVVELASLDGAVVIENSGKILAYGAVLRPKKAGKLRGSEGSRTKAAIGASNYGLAVKVSSDGDISVYYEGAPFLSV